MDDTHHSRVSDAAAAATRKRRSSILKSQRPARTPFSDLEFNVATPTDTAKSRRVSFSKRTGVAEFVTNEATTTWKNFYEEHNKSLESSSNDSEANASRQPVGHLGKRIFDQQFQEVEAVDFMSGLGNGSLNLNFSQQPISLECTEGKLTAPHNKFELSAFTEQSKLFGNDFTAPSLGENSGRIDVNFSAIQPVEKDDLDELEKDLQRGSNNMGCVGPFSNRQSMCEYIEVDLNMTHVVKNDEDMSITDTVHSPVQDVSKSISKASLNNDWVADKENIAVNPYAAPCETNFAVNEEPDQVLVFDGKRLTLQPDKDKNYRQTLLPNSSAETPERKSIVLNVNDDLPNFTLGGDMRKTKCENPDFGGFQQMKSNEDEISDTVQLSRVQNNSKRRTILDNTGNISITQALPTNIICQAAVISADDNPTKRRTIVFDKSSDDISVTEMVPVKFLSSSESSSERRQTLVYEDDTGNLSMTQAVPSNILVNENPDTIKSKCENPDFSGFQEMKSNEDEISDTVQLSRVQNKPKRWTILDNTGNISITQALPTNIICQAAVISEDDNPTKRRTIVFDKSSNDISVTEMVPVKLLSSSESLSERRRTVVYEDDTGNLSMTQAVPSNILLKENPDTIKNEIFDSDKAQALSLNTLDEKPSKRKTIVFDHDGCDVSFTQAVPSNIILAGNTLDEKPSKRKTIVFDHDACDVSFTQAVPSNIILADNTLDEKPSKRKTIVFDHDACDVSFTQAVPSNIILADKLSQEKRRTIIFENETADISVTQVLPTNVILSNNEPNPERRRTVVYNDDSGNISVTQALPSNIILENLQSDDNYEAGDIPTSQSLLNNITAKNSDASRRRTIIYANETGNISITQAIPAQLIPGYSEEKPADALNTSKRPRKRQTIVYDNDSGDISMTETITANIIEEAKSERKTIAHDDNEANMSLAISTNVFLLDKLDSAVDCVKKTEESKEINEKVTDYDVYKENGTNSLVEPSQDEQKSNVFNADVNDCNMSMTMAISKVPSLRETEKGDMSMTKPIPAELITFSTELSDKLKDKLLDLTEPEQIVSHQSDVIVLQSSRTNSKPNLQSSTSEQGELRNIGDIYNEIFKDSSVMKMASTTFVGDDVTRSSLGDVSANASLMHPRVEEKINQLSLIATHNDWKVETVGDGGQDDAIMQTDAEQKQESVVNTEMSLSVTTIDSGTDDKNIMARVDSSQSPPSIDKGSDVTSNESMFYITKDDDDAHTNRDVDNDEATRTEPKQTTYNQLPMLQLEEGLQAVDELQKKLAELQTAMSQSRSNSYFEKSLTPDLEEVAELDEDDKPRPQEHSYKSANDTRELLNMLSSLTDNIDSDNDIEPVVVKVKRSEITEHKRLSFAPNRQSIVLSREDLLSNISMAQAALQKSRLALDDTDSPEDESKDVSVDISEKSARAVNEVVKTLQFNDESINEEMLNEYSPLKKTAFGETSYMHESKGKVIPTFLKDVSDGIKELMLDLVKPVNNDNLPFETGVVDKGVPMIGSTHSTQIQANLAASSQIDLDSASNPESNTDLYSETPYDNMSRSRSLRSPVKFSGTLSEFDDPDSKERWLHTHTPAEPPPAPAVLIFDHLNPLNNVLLPSIDFTEAHKYDPIIKSEEKLRLSEAPHTSRLATPPHTSRLPTPPHTHSIGIHYNHTCREDNSRDFEVQTLTTTKKQQMVTRSGIAQKEVTVMTTKRRFANTSSTLQEEVTVTNTQGKMTPRSSPTQEDITKQFREKNKEPNPNEQLGVQSVASKRLSLDQSVDAVLTKLRDDEVNTTIAMKRNKELLETSSSLTLVDDALEGQTSPVLPDHELSKQRIRFSRSHLVDIEEQAAELESITKYSGISLQDDYSSNSNANITKSKKRIYSPATDKHRLQSSVEVTPKPLTKMQKISSSPKVQIKVPMELSSTDESAHSMEPEKDDNKSTDRSAHSSKSRGKKSPKKTGKPGQTITVRQLIADCISFDTGFQQINDFQEKLLGDPNPKSGSLMELSHSDMSFTSSKDLKSMKDALSTENMDCQSLHQSTMQEMPTQLDWHPELMYKTSTSQCDSDSGVNVVAKIDMLPFMGSHECEWESSSSADTWAFRLLHGRLRLTARLAHRLDNATRTRVRGDTPVLDIAVEAVQHERKNPVATMCVRFACETMRHIVARALRAKCRASDVPALLRRCAAVVRVALRWGRAMHDAKLHLAYTMDSDGNLSLKVANIPLRSVWEVTMRIELVADESQGMPCPCALGVRVLPVVSDVLVPDARVRRALSATPKDWGHAPRTIWRVFRLLKHKKRDDDLLLA